MVTVSRARFRRGRKRAIRKVRADGRYYGYGREEVDARSGWLFPVKFMQPNYGRLVSSFYRDGSYDYSFSDRIDAALVGRNAVPTISVTASVATASETGPTQGIFTLQRLGDTSTAFDVQVGVDGSAIAGTNFLSIPLVVHFAIGDVLKQVLVTPIPGGLAINPGNKVILTAVPDGSSNYYAAFTSVPIGPLSSTDFIITLNNQAVIQIVP